MKSQLSVLAALILVLALASTASAKTIQISGGGTDVLYTAINDKGTTAGDTIEFMDSLVYTETKDAQAIGKANLTIMAAAGQNPQVNFSSKVNYSGSIQCNATGFKFGSNAGGPITVRKASVTASAGAFSSVWFNSGQVLTIENVIFTSEGSTTDTLWNGGLFWGGIGGAVANGATVNFNNVKVVDVLDSTVSPFSIGYWNGPLFLNCNDCTFTQTTAPTQMQMVNDIAQAPAAYTFNHCAINNQHMFLWETGNSATFSECLFTNGGFVNIGVYDIATSFTTTVKNCAFSNNVYNILIWPCAPNYPTIKMDHCDSTNGGYLVWWNTAAQCAIVNVTNTNTGSSPFMGGTTSVLAGCSQTYSYCNLGATPGAHSIDGGHNIASPGLTPGYYNLPTNWMYGNKTLATADSMGGPIGSWLHQSSMGLVPVTASRFWAE